MTEHFFYAKHNNGRIETQGTNYCLLGHKIVHTPQKRPDGIYVEWHWDGNKLVVENDRYGFYPVYYFCRDNEIGISPSILQLLRLGAPNELDYRALSVILRIPFFVGEDTPFRYIRALPPGARLEWKDSKLSLSGGFPVIRRMSVPRNDAIDQYIALFRQSIQRRLPREKFILPMSGGRDSRHILLELCELGYRPEFCVTHEHFPTRPNEDIKIARQVTDHLGVKLRYIPQAKSYFKAEWRNHRETSFCALDHSQLFCMVDALGDQFGVSYDGLAGDVLSAGHFLDPKTLQFFEAGEYEKMARYLFYSDYTETGLKSALSNDFYRKVNLEIAVEHFSNELKRHTDYPSPTTSFFYYNRTRRVASLISYAILRNIPTVYSPYIDHDVYDFLMSMEERFFLDKKFHTEAILRAYPKAAHLPFEDKRVPPRSSTLFRKRFLLEFMKYSMMNLKYFRQCFKPEYAWPRMCLSLARGPDEFLGRAQSMFYLMRLHKAAEERMA